MNVHEQHFEPVAGLQFPDGEVVAPHGLTGLVRDQFAHGRLHAIVGSHGGLDGFTMCRDYCMNQGPFLSPGQFSEFVAPYLARQTRGYRDMGFYTIKHTDGNIMPIVDQIVQTGPAHRMPGGCSARTSSTSKPRKCAVKPRISSAGICALRQPKSKGKHE